MMNLIKANEYTKVIEINPSDAFAYSNRESVYYKKGCPQSHNVFLRLRGSDTVESNEPF
jgi:hypothetical protein